MIIAQYQKLSARVDALQLRERILLLIASLIIAFFLVDSFGLQPVFKELQSLQRNISEQEHQMEVLLSRSSLLTQEPDITSKTDTLQTLAELATLGSRLHNRIDNMLSPDLAARVLEQVLNRDGSLMLHEVSANRTPMTITEESTGEIASIPGLFRYELELELEGSYMATLKYLRALEALPWNFFWKGVNYKVTDFPNALVTLDIYTLGLL